MEEAGEINAVKNTELLNPPMEIVTATGMVSSVEEKVVGGGGLSATYALVSAAELEESQAAAAAAEVMEVDNRPLLERIVDKNWKTRQIAYDELKREAKAVSSDANNALFGEYASILPKMAGDINAGALDSGLDAALVFVDACPPALSRAQQDRVFASVVDKTFSARPSTQAK